MVFLQRFVFYFFFLRRKRLAPRVLFTLRENFFCFDFCLQNQMRDRRPLLGHAVRDVPTVSTDDDKRRKCRASQGSNPLLTANGILSHVLFFFLILGLPLGLIYYYTPFFVFERLQCRLSDKVWRDDKVNAVEEGYQGYAGSPPRFLSLEYNKTMLWGTYEPGMLFAMKTRTPKPVYIGVAWYDEAGEKPVRFRLADVLSIRQLFLRNSGGGRNGDEMNKNNRKTGITDEKWDMFEASWAVHDGVHYGRQTVQDGPLSVNIEFLKSPSGDSWHVRVHGNMNGAKPIRFLVYVVNDGGESIVPIETQVVRDVWRPQIASEFKSVKGRRSGFSLLLRDDHNPFLDTPPWEVDGLKTSGDEFIQNADLRSLSLNAHKYASGSSILERWKYPRNRSVSHNVMVFQKKFKSDFRLELTMRHTPNLETPAQDETVHGEFVVSADGLTSCQLTNVFRQREKGVLQRMRSLVTPWAKGFAINRKLFINRARRTLSGALGSWGYWYGRYLYVDPIIDSSWKDQEMALGSKSERDFQEMMLDVSAFGAVSSRTEGAYSDLTLTGMHLLFLAQWNKEWTKEALASWLVGAIDKKSGFIPRYATFTAASRAFAAPSAQYEHLNFAAPPTPLLALYQLLQSDRGMGTERDFFELLLPSLRRWRAWFHLTQSTNNDAMSLEALTEQVKNAGGKRLTPPMYRWRSRDDYRIPASGMPDYPRPFCEGYDNLEAHVDLFSWVAFLSMIVSEVELHLGYSESVPKLLWMTWLDEVHWDPVNQRYADRLGCPDAPFSPYVGYANLFPFILGIVDNKERAMTIMNLAESQLMTPYGLMSVSHDSVRAARLADLRHENRWMGQVRVSTNALVLNALRMKYITLLGPPAEEFFWRLRLSIVKAVGPSNAMPEAFDPVTGDPEITVSLMGHRALLLALLKGYN